MARSLHAGCSARRSRRHCVCLWQRKRARPAAPPVASAAADFAAKEAFLKAAGTGLREPFSLCEIEAVRLPGGAPAYHFSGRSAQWVEAHRLRAHLSLSHEDGMAMAYCILETET